MIKKFDDLISMKKFLFENDIHISFSDLKFSIETGYIFYNNDTIECYFDDINNSYVLEV